MSPPTGNTKYISSCGSCGPRQISEQSCRRHKRHPRATSHHSARSPVLLFQRLKNPTSFVLTSFSPSTYMRAYLWRSAYPLAGDEASGSSEAWYVPPRGFTHCGLAGGLFESLVTRSTSRHACAWLSICARDNTVGFHSERWPHRRAIPLVVRAHCR
jgi:hypothetical protein